MNTQLIDLSTSDRRAFCRAVQPEIDPVAVVVRDLERRGRSPRSVAYELVNILKLFRDLDEAERAVQRWYPWT